MSQSKKDFKTQLMTDIHKLLDQLIAPLQLDQTTIDSVKENTETPQEIKSSTDALKSLYAILNNKEIDGFAKLTAFQIALERQRDYFTPKVTQEEGEKSDDFDQRFGLASSETSSLLIAINSRINQTQDQDLVKVKSNIINLFEQLPTASIDSIPETITSMEDLAAKLYQLLTSNTDRTKMAEQMKMLIRNNQSIINDFIENSDVLVFPNIENIFIFCINQAYASKHPKHNDKPIDMKEYAEYFIGSKTTNEFERKAYLLRIEKLVKSTLTGEVGADVIAPQASRLYESAVNKESTANKKIDLFRALYEYQEQIYVCGTLTETDYNLLSVITPLIGILRNQLIAEFQLKPKQGEEEVNLKEIYEQCPNLKVTKLKMTTDQCLAHLKQTIIAHLNENQRSLYIADYPEAYNSMPNDESKSFFLETCIIDFALLCEAVKDIGTDPKPEMKALKFAVDSYTALKDVRSILDNKRMSVEDRLTQFSEKLFSDEIQQPLKANPDGKLITLLKTLYHTVRESLSGGKFEDSAYSKQLEAKKQLQSLRQDAEDMAPPSPDTPSA